MVKGRRVRAVVAYARKDDCCSPNPKRRDRDNGAKLAAAGQKQTMTKFFQAVNIDYSKSIASPLTSGLNIAEELNNIEDLSCHDTDDHFDVERTLQFEGFAKDVLSPPTPHRIELHIDNENSRGAIRPVAVSEPADVAPTKAARSRLNNRQANHIEKTNHKLTEYYPVRRSARKTKKTVLEEKQQSLERAVRNAVEDGLEMRCFGVKGRGVVATKLFSKGDFVVEYSGELVELSEAKLREQKYSEDQNTGCYMYYFKHKSQQYCIDATAESVRLGRLVNHSRNGNLLTRTVSIDGKPRLVLIAKDDIEAGEEITYDYGDRSKESLKHHPWLAL